MNLKYGASGKNPKRSIKDLDELEKKAKAIMTEDSIVGDGLTRECGHYSVRNIFSSCINIFIIYKFIIWNILQAHPSRAPPPSFEQPPHKRPYKQLLSESRPYELELVEARSSDIRQLEKRLYDARSSEMLRSKSSSPIVSPLNKASSNKAIPNQSGCHQQSPAGLRNKSSPEATPNKTARRRPINVMLII